MGLRRTDFDREKKFRNIYLITLFSTSTDCTHQLLLIVSKYRFFLNLHNHFFTLGLLSIHS